MRTFTIAGIGALGLLTATAAFGADGKEVYTKSCALCHNAMPPKLGDKAAWAPRLQLGEDAMVATVIKGKGAMPPRGGHAGLSDADIRAAVQYMMTQAK